ncbi:MULTISPECIES: DMT family transporter [unclassified Devosia]|uniref:DMT family transporter n=1 Tax=unclassified Devosia TaxID=196773 RepID=UPI001552784D|nr:MULTISPECIES: DMT family transporter [unclassified Devosia]
MTDRVHAAATHDRRSTGLADLAVLGVAVVWGASYPVSKGALAYAPVLVLIFYRFFATACIMSMLARRELASAARADLVRAAVLGVILAVIFIAEIAGLAQTSATNAALIISLSTLFTPFLDYALARRVPPPIVILGAVIACAGVGCLVGGLTAWSPGDGLILLAAMLRAVMVVATKRLMAGRALSSVALTATQAVIVSVVALAMLWSTQGLGALVVAAGPSFWASVAFLSLFCTIAAFYVQNAAVRRTSPTRVGFLMGTEPLFGFALAHLLLAEPVTASTLVGAALIVAGTFLGMAGERRELMQQDARAG